VKELYKTKGKINVYAFDTGETIEMVSNRVIPWNKENDERYDLSEEDKKEFYEHTCGRLALKKHFNDLIPALTLKERNAILRRPALIFDHVPKTHIPHAELVMVYYDRDRFVPAWVSLDDLKRKEETTLL
jgi:hypothetical protein